MMQRRKVLGLCSGYRAGGGWRKRSVTHPEEGFGDALGRRHH